MPRTRSTAAAALLVAVLAGCGGDEAVPVVREAALRAEPAGPPDPPPVPVVQSGDGRLTPVPGAGEPAGQGELTTYVVEVEGGLGVDPVAFADEVERTLSDPRSWAARRAVQRVAGDDAPQLRVVLASPALTDRLCAPLDTGGYFSCANGAMAVLNAARWLRGAPTYAGHLEEYRAYVVNHEVGHTLGLGHARCPGAGQPAPVMLQQTKGLEGCTRSPWPYP